MANNAYIITSEYIKIRSQVEDNVDDNLITPVIRKSQIKYIIELLGKTLYEKIIADIVADTLTGNYKTLVDDYVSPTLLDWVLYEGMPSFNFKITNKAVSTNNSDNSEATTLDVIIYLRNDYKNSAQYMAKQTIKYLCLNSTLFPEYTGENDLIQPDKTAYSGQLYLGE